MKLNLPHWKGIRKRIIISSITLLLSCSFSILQAQNMSIKGSIKDESGQGLPGASVVVKGTSTGAVTDNDGNFTLELAKGSTLIISYVGYDNQEIIVNDNTPLSIQLTSGKSLNEVVVVGYGTQRKKDVTGSVVSVSEATLKEVPAPNLLNQLKGRAAGVSIVSNGATPGAQGQIRIRGNRTLTTSAGGSDGLDGPLVVVDGIPFGGLNDINPDDIASLEILKDASATAIFGSRGAGGVILVTTKRGKIGKPVLSLTAIMA
jgi:TonB-dependent SusC/RagA subfamily outer membrane receptor